MWGILTALAAAAALVAAGAAMPGRRARAEARLLARARDALLRDQITLDEAEDALVLARRHGQKILEGELRKKISEIKKRRGK